MHRKRGAPDSPRIVADAKETACTRVISSPYRITESAEILSCLNPLPNPALLGFQSVEIQASSFSTRREVFFQRALGTCILLEDDIGFGGPLEGLRFGVALGEPGLDAG